jgi:hypothetical protein
MDVSWMWPQNIYDNGVLELFQGSAILPKTDGFINCTDFYENWFHVVFTPRWMTCNLYVTVVTTPM